MEKDQMNKSRVIRREMFAPSELIVRESGEGEEPSRVISGYAILFDTLSAPLWDDEDSTAREMIAGSAVTQELLDGSDIKMTMFHNRELILARSNKGQGTLKYSIDERGVKFEFEAPRTIDGDKALELVRRGELAGCSFAFSTRYWDQDFVKRSVQVVNGHTEITYRVEVITGIYDFTIAADPAYEETSVEVKARELKAAAMAEPEADREDTGRCVAEAMRRGITKMKIY